MKYLEEARSQLGLSESAEDLLPVYIASRIPTAKLSKRDSLLSSKLQAKLNTMLHHIALDSYLQTQSSLESTRADFNEHRDKFKRMEDLKAMKVMAAIKDRGKKE